MTQVSGANTEQPTYDAVIKKTFTKIDGRPSRRNRDNLLIEVEKVLVCLIVPGFDWARKYGLLAETREGTEWEQLTGKVYEEPSNEEPTDTHPHIKKKWKEEKKERKKVKWDSYKTSCYKRFGACNTVCCNIRDVLDEK